MTKCNEKGCRKKAIWSITLYYISNKQRNIKSAKFCDKHMQDMLMMICNKGFLAQGKGYLVRRSERGREWVEVSPQHGYNEFGWRVHGSRRGDVPEGGFTSLPQGTALQGTSPQGSPVRRGTTPVNRGTTTFPNRKIILDRGEGE